MYDQKDMQQTVHNHLDNILLITTKPGLLTSLRSYYNVHEPSLQANYCIFDSMPTSFIVKGCSLAMEYPAFARRFNELSGKNFSKERMPTKHCKENLWLVKPADLNQGKGIQVCNKFSEITSCIRTKPAHSVWLVQKYIERPLLFQDRKFDIRVWGLFTANHDIFYYKKGYLRTSSRAYDLNSSDAYVHLTNNCLQQRSTDYGKFEEGNSLSFEDFQRFLDEEFPHISFERDIEPRIKDLVIDVGVCAKKQIQKIKKPLCFELLGFDFLIDEDFRVWLIEVNTNPYLGLSNAYLKETVPKMIEDLLELTLDLHFPQGNKRNSPETNTNNADKKINFFELLYCETYSKYSYHPVNKRRSFHYTLYPGFGPRVRKSRHNSVQSFKQNLLSEVKSSIDKNKDFKQTARKITDNLNNWDNLNDETKGYCIEGLNLLMNSPGVSVFSEKTMVKSLIKFMNSENANAKFMCAIINGMNSTKLKKQFSKFGISHILIKLIYSDSKEIRDMATEALFILATHPCKKVWIPGESDLQNRIRKRILKEGVLLALISLDPIPSDFINKEFKLSECDAQIKSIQENSLSLPLSMTNSADLAQRAIETLKEISLAKQTKAENKRKIEKERKEAELVEKIKEHEDKEREKAKKILNLREQSRKRRENNRRVQDRMQMHFFHNDCKNLEMYSENQIMVKDRRKALSHLFRNKDYIEKLCKKSLIGVGTPKNRQNHISKNVCNTSQSSTFYRRSNSKNEQPKYKVVLAPVFQ